MAIRTSALLIALAGGLLIADEYTLGPDSERQPQVPRGAVTQYSWTSQIFPGTVRDYWVYVPAQYDASKPACVMSVNDSGRPSRSRMPSPSESFQPASSSMARARAGS